jgi:hypothetical protein
MWPTRRDGVDRMVVGVGVDNLIGRRGLPFKMRPGASLLRSPEVCLSSLVFGTGGGLGFSCCMKIIWI